MIEFFAVCRSLCQKLTRVAIRLKSDVVSQLLLVLLCCFPLQQIYAQESIVLDALRDQPTESGSLLALPPEPEGEAAEDPFEDEDIFFDRLSAEQEKDIVDRAFPLLAAKWPFNKVFVCWEEVSAEYFEQRSQVRAAVKETWEAVSGLEFLGWGQCSEASSGIRIKVSDTGPHVKFLGKFLNGVADGMVLNFDYGNWGIGCHTRIAYCNRVIAVHEFGHAIGFAHEQNRPDTPGECDKKQGSAGDDITLTPWDPQSVMNYCNPVYNNDGVLSQFDIVAVQYIYGEA